MKMHYSDMGWYIGSIKDYLGLPKVRERRCFKEVVVCVCMCVCSEEDVYMIIISWLRSFGIKTNLGRLMFGNF